MPEENHLLDSRGNPVDAVGMENRNQRLLRVDVAEQAVRLWCGGELCGCWPVSTSAAGTGGGEGSGCTPTGWFRIAAKIGDGEPMGTIFRGREAVGRWLPELAADAHAAEDLILSRILWLDGIEDANANTLNRYIYFHGTNHEEMIGTPCSHGCIRLRNADMLEVFALVEVDDLVEIV